MYIVGKYGQNLGSLEVEVRVVVRNRLKFNINYRGSHGSGNSSVFQKCFRIFFKFSCISPMEFKKYSKKHGNSLEFPIL